MGVWKINWNDEWIYNNHAEYSNNKLFWVDYCKLFEQVEYDSFRKHVSKIGLGSNVGFSEDQNNWLKQNYRYYELEECKNEFNKTFKTHKSKAAIAGQVGDLGLTRKASPIGTILTIDGYKRIKTAKGRRGWEKYSRFVWEQHYGKIPKDYSIIHLDNDLLNDDINNLMAVPNSWLGTLQQYDWFSENPTLTQTALMCCDLHAKLNNKAGLLNLNIFKED